MQAAFVSGLAAVREQLRATLEGQLNKFMEEQVYAPLVQPVK